LLNGIKSVCFAVFAEDFIDRGVHKISHFLKRTQKPKKLISMKKIKELGYPTISIHNSIQVKPSPHKPSNKTSQFQEG
jgi:hypothetical protein